MELINTYISLVIKKKSSIPFSSLECISTEDQVQLKFAISPSDCSYEFLEKYDIIISIKKEYFEKYSDSFNFKNKKRKLTYNIESEIIKIINCNQNGIQRKIFIESIILSIISELHFDVKSLHKNKIIAGFQGNLNIDKIEHAREFILENINKNVTIPVIALEVGTNQSYLKKGFKQICQLTIFEFIQNTKMDLAKKLIKETDQTLTSIGISIGYSSLSSFSQSYKKYFGKSPSAEQRLKFPNN